MDLPTYTSIWRIEKRLYKLYDFRLPMPLPVGQISVFAAIAVPYVVLLGVLGLPFNHTLIWLYILPPGALTWLATRPVLEGKRLPELIKSQIRYLAEPRVWCRMAPSSERDVVLVTGRVWRPSKAAAERSAAARRPAGARRPAVARRPAGRPAARPAVRPRPPLAERGRGAPPPVERAPAVPEPGRGDARPGRAATGPGGHRAGSPDQLQRDRERAQLPVAAPVRIIVLGCTVGAGQTMTALMTGETLASLRTDRIAAIDVNPGAGSLARRAIVRVPWDDQDRKSTRLNSSHPEVSRMPSSA